MNDDAKRIYALYENAMHDELEQEIDRDKHGNVVYTLDGAYHREDGPAIETSDGGQIWMMNNDVHRLDGPAIVISDNLNRFFADELLGFFHGIHEIDAHEMNLDEAKKIYVVGGHVYGSSPSEEYIDAALEYEGKPLNSQTREQKIQDIMHQDLFG